MSDRSVLAVNGGSSSLKCGLFTASDSPEPLETFNLPIDSDEPNALVACLQSVLTQISAEHGAESLIAIGHRVVHGGDNYDGPVMVGARVMKRLEDFVSLAPLHQPANLELIRYCERACPGVPQVACFDTAFHRGMPAVARSYALPRELTDAGVHAYGFHGLSYEYVWEQLQAPDARAADKRIIIAHLGAGASLCAIKDGRSIATTMGFSTADGLPMATRTGSIDPGVLVHLMREHAMQVEDLERLIYRDGGLKGMSGISGSLVELRASSCPQAREAIDYFVYRVVREIGSLTAALEGLDMLVFTGGIGANDPSIRQQVTDRLRWLGDDLDVRAVPANEEAMIAAHTLRVLNGEKPANQEGG